MKNLLFYYPSNKRSVQIETLLKTLRVENVAISFLSLTPRGALHEKLDDFGIRTYANPIEKSGILYYFHQLLFLIRFLRKNKIEIVFSNLQQANLIAIFARFFVKSEIICFRHHFKFFPNSNQLSYSVNRNERIGDKLVNLFARKIIVPSSGVFNGMVNQEKVNPAKVQIIPYMYDFENYGEPDLDNVKQIKREHPSKLRLIMVSRLIPLKRHLIILPMIQELIDQGLDLHLFILDEGPEKEKIENFIQQNNLANNVSLLGFRRDFLDYMAASDLIIHPSITEASNSAVKEMALLEKTAIVCQGVGDFDDYIEDQVDGFTCDIEKFPEEAKAILNRIHQQPEILHEMGKKLRNKVLKQFSVTPEITLQYVDLIHG